MWKLPPVNVVILRKRTLHLPVPQEKRAAHDPCFSTSLDPWSESFHGGESSAPHTHPSLGPAGLHSAHATIQRMCEQSIVLCQTVHGGPWPLCLEAFPCRCKEDTSGATFAAPQGQLDSGTPPSERSCLSPSETNVSLTFSYKQ